ncbi:PEP-CTERM-box response regulator transcription factor [Megalodesulfovibrio paquesii]
MNTLLIVDDNEDIRQQLRWGLGRESYNILFAENAQQAVALFRQHQPPVVTLDLGLPPHQEDAREGLRCLTEMLSLGISSKIIVITGFEDAEHARIAVESGAYDFFRKPVDLGDLRVMIRRAFQLHQIESESRAEVHPHPVATHRVGLVGNCAAMRQVFSLVDKVAASDAPVLITGESGTGKELVARAIHAGSHRHKNEMISVNCGAIPENLVESEFFGHEKGAFTGANATVRGKLEYAHNSTLFLDEIGEMPIQMQVKFLRFLQEMAFMRVGGRKTLNVNVRIVAATNADVKQQIAEARFREDLYYRLGVVSVHMPPLRQRGEDILELARHFLEKYGSDASKPRLSLAPETEKLITAYPWPGNVRELENCIRRACILTRSARLTPADLDLPDTAAPQALELEAKTLREARSIVERKMIEDALRRHDGNIQRTADALGISRPTLYDLMRKHGVSA